MSWTKSSEEEEEEVAAAAAAGMREVGPRVGVEVTIGTIRHHQGLVVHWIPQPVSAREQEQEQVLRSSWQFPWCLGRETPMGVPVEVPVGVGRAAAGRACWISSWRGCRNRSKTDCGRVLAAMMASTGMEIEMEIGMDMDTTMAIDRVLASVR